MSPGECRGSSSALRLWRHRIPVFAEMIGRWPVRPESFRKHPRDRLPEQCGASRGAATTANPREAASRVQRRLGRANPGRRQDGAGQQGIETMTTTRGWRRWAIAGVVLGLAGAAMATEQMPARRTAPTAPAGEARVIVKFRSTSETVRAAPLDAVRTAARPTGGLRCDHPAPRRGPATWPPPGPPFARRRAGRRAPSRTWTGTSRSRGLRPRVRWARCALRASVRSPWPRRPVQAPRSRWPNGAIPWLSSSSRFLAGPRHHVAPGPAEEPAFVPEMGLPEGLQL